MRSKFRHETWRILLAAVAAMLAAIAPVVTADDTAVLPQRALRAGNHAFSVEVATTPQQRQHGLMSRARLGDDEGMLFIFEKKSSYCFWMKDT